MGFNALPADMKRLVAGKLMPDDMASLMQVNKSTSTALEPLMSQQATPTDWLQSFSHKEFISKIWKAIQELDTLVSQKAPTEKVQFFKGKVMNLGWLAKTAHQNYKSEVPEQVWRAVNVKFKSFKNMTSSKKLDAMFDWQPEF